VSFSPLPASLRLSAFLAAEYDEFPELFRETIGRLTDSRENINTHNGSGPLKPVEASLLEYRKKNTNLFAEEKHNLFIDDAREVIIWSEVLSQLDFRSSDKKLVKGVIEWTTDGIQSLTGAAMEEGADGPLGWTSKPDIFVLGLRVLHVSKVLLQWSKLYPKEVDVKNLITGMRGFVEQGDVLQLHENWMETAKNVFKNFEDGKASRRFDADST
jgi:hypothetical protein